MKLKSFSGLFLCTVYFIENFKEKNKGDYAEWRDW